MSGWISLHRKILDWEWYDDSNACRLFIHCLLRANHQPKKWKGINIDRGQFITSLDKLSKETGLSVSKIRTCIKKLKSTNEIASKSHTQHTVITVISYDSYQSSDKQCSKRMTNESQTNDKQIATNNNDNKENNGNKITIDFSPLAFSAEEIKEFKDIRARKRGAVSQRVINEHAKQFELSRQRGYTNDDILNEWSTRGWTAYKDAWMKVELSKKVTREPIVESHYDPIEELNRL